MPYKLSAYDPDLIAFLDDKNRNWADTQTIPPGNITGEPLSADSVQISWTPILDSSDGGYYRIKYATESGGPYTQAGVTDDKNAADYEVTGLSPGTYYFVVETYTPAYENHQSDLTSDPSPEYEMEFTGLPEINVRTADNTDIPDAASFDFGTAFLGAPISIIFTVENTGTADLILTEPVTLPQGFFLLNSFDSTTLSPSDSAFFEVQLDDTLGTSEGELSFGNNDPDEDPYNFTITGTVDPTPEIEVSVDGADVSDGGSVEFGDTIVGTPVVKTFTISNSGTADLTLSNPTLPDGFSLDGAFPDSIATNGSKNFQIRLDAEASGAFSDTLSFDTNDIDENPFSFALAGTVNAVPEIEVSVDGTDIPNSGSVSFGSTVVGSAIIKTISVANTGTADLILSNLALTDGFSLVGAFLNDIAAGGTESFQVQLDADSVGTHSGPLSFDTDDNDENPFSFTITGEVNPEPEPEIGVSADGTDIPDGGTVSFGSTVAGSSVVKTFTVSNTGEAALNLSNLALPEGFSLTGTFPASVAARGAEDFQVRLDAVSANAYSGPLSFETDDSDENPFSFTITGEVNPEPEPEIGISADGTDIPDRGTVRFGSTVAGSSVVKIFTVSNTGEAALNLSNLALPEGFSQVGTFPASVVARGAEDFQVRLDAVSANAYSGTLSFDTDDSDENPFSFTITGTVNPTSEPEIGVSAASADIPDRGTVSFNATVLGTPIVKTFTIANTGSADLTLSNLTLPEGFSLIGTFPASIATGGTEDFQVRLDADSSGTYSGALRFDNNDADENPYNFTITGTVNPKAAPEIEISADSTDIPDGSSLSFGSVVVGNDVTKTFIIRNTGTAALTLGNLTLPEGFSLVGEFSDNIAMGETDRFQVRLDADRPASFSGILRFDTNDDNENPYDFTLTAEVNPEPVPEIEISVDGAEILNGGAVSFGDTVVGTPVVKTFTVRNTGTATLTLSNLTLPEGFRPEGEFPDNIAAGGTGSFQIWLNAESPDAFSGVLRFDTNDTDENPCNFTLSATVSPVPVPEIEVFVDGMEIPDGGSVNFGSATEGTPLTRTFIIRNTGTAALPLSGLTLPRGFSRDDAFPVNVAAGGKDSFQIRLEAEIPGSFRGTLRFNTGDKDENPYNITLRGVVTPLPTPEIEVSVDGTVIPISSDVSFEATAGISVFQTFTIRNVGTADLRLSNLVLPWGYTLVSAFPDNVVAGGTDSFQIRLDAFVSGIFDGTLRFASNDADENPCIFILRGAVYPEPVPEIEIWDGDTDIPDGGSVAFDSTILFTPVVKVFTVRNTGLAYLHLSNLELPEGFSLIGAFPESIAAGAADSFQVQLNAWDTGIFEGAIRFDTDDADENPCNFNINGSVYPEPVPEIKVWDGDISIPNLGIVEFGSTLIGTPVTKIFTVRNTGTAILKLENLELPEGFSLIGIFPYEVAPGGADDFQIQLDAAAEGEFVGSLRFDTNDENESSYSFTVRAAVHPEPVPEIEVWDGDTHIPDLGTTDLGSTLIGSPVAKIFTVRNTGTAMLTLGIPELPQGFSLIGDFPSQVAAGGVESFQTQLNAAFTGEFSGDLRFETNDNDEGVYIFSLTGRVNSEPEPETEVSDGDTDIPNNGVVNFGITLMGTPVTKTFTIRNTGTAALNLSGIDLPEGFDLIGFFPHKVATGGTDSFEIRLNASAQGEFEGALGFETDDDDESPYRFTIRGTVNSVPEPGIEVWDGDTEIQAGGAANFGEAALGMTVTKTFTVMNTGTAILTLDGLELPEGFSLTGRFPDVIEPGGADRFQVQFDAVTAGAFSGLLSFDTNDSDNDPYYFNMAGTVRFVNDIPVITGQQPLSTMEEAALTITLNDLTVNDSDNIFPNDFTLTVQEGAGYTVAGIVSDAQDTLSVVSGDVDGDGDTDLIVGNDDDTLRMYLNNGTTNPFNGVVGTEISDDTRHTSSVILGDVDGDGDLDIIAGNYGTENRLYLNNGTMDPFGNVSGTDITEDANHTCSTALGDVDGDGDLDMIAGNEGEANRLYLNNGTDEPFKNVIGTDITPDIHKTLSVVLSDMDSDGDPDLIAGNEGEANRLYLNNGTDDPFAGVAGVDITSDVHKTHSVVSGDVDGDGDLDMIAGNEGEAN